MIKNMIQSVLVTVAGGLTLIGMVLFMMLIVLAGLLILLWSKLVNMNSGLRKSWVESRSKIAGNARFDGTNGNGYQPRDITDECTLRGCPPYRYNRPVNPPRKK